MNLWTESYASLVVHNFTANQIPWRLHNRWIKCTRILISLILSHIRYEANTKINLAAYYGANIVPNQELSFNYKPN